MSIPYRNLIMFLILALSVVTGFSQEVTTKKTESKTSSIVTNEEPREDGLRKITTRTPRDWDFDIHLDEEALEANIELAVEQAMKELEVTLEKLEKLEIHLEPIEINVQKLNLDMKPIEVQLPQLNIAIEPIVIELDDLDSDIDIDEEVDHDVDNGIDNDDTDNFLKKDKNKEELKNKSDNKDKSDKEKTEQKEKDKAKGLKKLN